MTNPIELDPSWLRPGAVVSVDPVTTGRLVGAVSALADELERLRAQVAGLGQLPTGWRVADEVTMAHLRWAAHVMGGIEPTNRDAKLHSRALNDLRQAMHRMDNCPMPPAEHLWPAAPAITSETGNAAAPKASAITPESAPAQQITTAPAGSARPAEPGASRARAVVPSLTVGDEPAPWRQALQDIAGSIIELAHPELAKDLAALSQKAVEMAKPDSPLGILRDALAPATQAEPAALVRRAARPRASCSPNAAGFPS